MEPLILALASLALLLVVLGGLAFTVLRTANKSKDKDEEAEQQQEAPAVVVRQAAAPVGGRQAARDRMIAGLRRRVAERQADPQEGEGGPAAEDDEGLDAGTGSDEDEQGGAPGNRREARRAARREAAQADRAAQEAQQSKRSVYEERRAKKDAEREAQEQAQEDEMRRAAEERARREEEEAAKWMSMIKVEAEGVDAVDEDGEGGEGGLASQFVDYILHHKTVPLEALALEFGLRTQDAIDRIHGLEASGRITGVMDERGKYIYVSRPEMEAFAQYVRSRGRVAISELAARSSQFIDLEPKAPEARSGGAVRPALNFDDVLGLAATS